jgi:hypothetical protein
MRKLSAAIYVRCPEDVQAVRDFHAAGGRKALTPEQLAQKDESYWNSRCRRMARPAEQLKRELQQLLSEFRDCPDPDLNNVQLLTGLTDQVHAAVLQLIDSGSFCGDWGMQ